jgi:putative acetyltransferase
VRIEPDDLSNPRVLALLAERRPLQHADAAEAAALGNPGPQRAATSAEAASSALKPPGLSVWSAWEGRQLLCCGALRRLGDKRIELAWLQTAHHWQRRGVGRAMLAHLVASAQAAAAEQMEASPPPGPGGMAARALLEAAGFSASTDRHAPMCLDLRALASRAGRERDALVRSTSAQGSTKDGAAR